MMNTDPFKSYRENTVRSSSAIDIFIQCHDEVIRLLHAAARAVETGDIEKKTHNLNRVLAFIVHLQAALDLAHGREAARWLNHFYILVRKQIFDGSAQLNPDLLRQAAGYFSEVRQVWEEALAMSSADPTSNPSLSPQNVPFRSPQEAAPAIASDVTGTSSPTDWSA